MPKIKTHKATAKRYRRTASDKLIKESQVKITLMLVNLVKPQDKKD